MSGTPITRFVDDLYSQFYFLDKRIFNMSYKEFEYRFLVYSDKIDRHIASRDTKTVALIINNYSYSVKSSDVLDLPKYMEYFIYDNLSYEQQEEYSNIKNRFFSKYNKNPSDVLIYKLFTQLQQVVFGYYKTEDKELIELSNNKIDLLLEVLEDIPKQEQVIIWCSDMQYLLPKIVKVLDSVSEFTGRNTKTRDKEKQDWENGKTRFFVSNQMVGGTGLNGLWKAKYVIFINNTFDYAHRKQAMFRSLRPEQKQSVRFITLNLSTGIEDMINNNLFNKTIMVNKFKTELEKRVIYEKNI